MQKPGLVWLAKWTVLVVALCSAMTKGTEVSLGGHNVPRHFLDMKQREAGSVCQPKQEYRASEYIMKRIWKKKKLWSSNEFHLILGFMCVCVLSITNTCTHMNICRPPTPLEGSVEWLCDLLPPATPHIHAPEKHPVFERACFHTPIFDMLQEAMVPSRGQQTKFSARLHALPHPSHHTHTCICTLCYFYYPYAHLSLGSGSWWGFRSGLCLCDLKKKKSLFCS